MPDVSSEQKAFMSFDTGLKGERMFRQRFSMVQIGFRSNIVTEYKLFGSFYMLLGK